MQGAVLTKAILSSGSGTVTSSFAVRGNDFYATPAVAVEALLRHEKLPHKLLEPACGDGAIVKILRKRGHKVTATDLIDRGCPDSVGGIDFLQATAKSIGKHDATITNPPFRAAEAFVRKSLEVSPRVYMLLRLAFLEGLRWEHRGLAKHFKRVLVFAPRIPFMHRHDFDADKRISSSAIPFAWFVWEKGEPSEPIIRWLDPRVK